MQIQTPQKTSAHLAANDKCHYVRRCRAKRQSDTRPGSGERAPIEFDAIASARKISGNEMQSSPVPAQGSIELKVSVPGEAAAAGGLLR
jgi:hypothetical protein